MPYEILASAKKPAAPSGAMDGKGMRPFPGLAPPGYFLTPWRAERAHWGAAFRFGYLKVPAEDFLLIAQAMGCEEAFSAKGLQ
ncbi:MAG: hypothetical protein ACJ76N_03455 [Thermoanaerobaculia bacterium]